jgi:SRSO17 transposase
LKEGIIQVTLSESLTSEIDLTAVDSWTDQLVEVEPRLGPHFARTEARQRVMAYLRGLLSPAERKNSWQLAEVLGDATPYGLQNLLGRASWAADAVRDELQQYVIDYLADAEAIQIIDETGFLKKGQASVGVARQNNGTAGRVENCQIGVFLAYASERDTPQLIGNCTCRRSGLMTRLGCSKSECRQRGSKALGTNEYICIHSR